MTIVAFPLDQVSGAPEYTGEMLRQTLSVLCGVAPSGRPLGANSGVRPGTPSTTVTATSTVWTVGPHAGILDVETPAAAGPYFYAVSANVTGAVNAADGSNPRIDLISIHLDDPAESDGSSTPAATAVYTAGTAASSPSAPATPARSIPIAQINVPVSGGGSPTVTWVGSAWNRATRAYMTNTTGQTITNALVTTVFGWTTLDSVGMGSYSAGVRTIATDGFYSISARITYPSNGSPVGQRVAQIAVNGTAVDTARSDGDTLHSTPLQVTVALPLHAGDTVLIQTYQSQGASQSLTTGADENNWSIVRIGPL